MGIPIPKPLVGGVPRSPHFLLHKLANDISHRSERVCTTHHSDLLMQCQGARGVPPLPLSPSGRGSLDPSPAPPPPGNALAELAPTKRAHTNLNPAIHVNITSTQGVVARVAFSRFQLHNIPLQKKFKGRRGCLLGVVVVDTERSTQ